MTATIEARRSIQQLRELYGDLHRFGQELREGAIAFQEMVRDGGFPEHGRAFSYSHDDPKDVLNRSIDITREFKFLVAVTGAFSSGKSTLLNLLLDQPELLPASVIPMTAVCTAIRYGERPRVQVRYVPYRECFDRVQACIDEPFLKPLAGPEHLAEAEEHPEAFVAGPTGQESLRQFAGLLRRFDEILRMSGPDGLIRFEQRAPYIAGGGLLPASDGGFRYFRPTPSEQREYLAQGGDPQRWVSREWLSLIRDVSLWVPSPLLENDIVFLDLPGLNCREDYHRRAIREYCNLADCILVTAFQPGNQADAEVIASFKRLSSNYHEKIFFVFNKVDQFVAEPSELVRAVDYLARDTIGADFPRRRFFLTSAHIARAYRAADSSWRNDVQRMQTALSGITGALPGLDEWVHQVIDSEDPGGVGHVKHSLYEFLVDEAYQTKVREIVRNYRFVLDSIRDAASPRFEQTLHMDATDILRKTVLEYLRYVEKLQRNAIYRFRFDYLRGHETDGTATLKNDLRAVLEDVHGRTEDIIRSYFDRPILATPLLEDLVSDFDLLTIADKAARNVRRELQELIIKTIHERICGVFQSYLEQSEFKRHLQNVLGGAPECIRQVEGILARFEDTMLHSQKCIVRTGFFHMPRGRQLKRLERSVPLSKMKDTLIGTFADFYPAWIYENIYGELIDRLWLSLFLDSEELEQELVDFFHSSESVVTGVHIAEQVEIPEKFADGTRGLYRAVRMCRRIEQLIQRQESLHEKAASIGVSA